MPNSSYREKRTRYWCVVIEYYLLGQLFTLGVVSWLARKCGFLRLQRFLVSGNYAGGNLLLYLISAVMIVALFHQEIGESIVSFFRVKPKTQLRNILCYTLGIGVIWSLLSFLASFATVYFGIRSSNESFVQQSLSMQGARWIMFVVSAALAPFVEEFIFRCFILGVISQKRVWLAYVVSSVLFGLHHVYDYIIYDGDYMQLFAAIPYAILGLGLCRIYAKTKNLCYPLAFHILTNALVGLAVMA